MNLSNVIVSHPETKLLTPVLILANIAL